jgi:hypothetical protein
MRSFRLQPVLLAVFVTLAPAVAQAGPIKITVVDVSGVSIDINKLDDKNRGWGFGLIIGFPGKKSSVGGSDTATNPGLSNPGRGSNASGGGDESGQGGGLQLASLNTLDPTDSQLSDSTQPENGSNHIPVPESSTASLLTASLAALFLVRRSIQ